MMPKRRIVRERVVGLARRDPCRDRHGECQPGEHADRDGADQPPRSGLGEACQHQCDAAAGERGAQGVVQALAHDDVSRRQRCGDHRLVRLRPGEAVHRRPQRLLTEHEHRGRGDQGRRVQTRSTRPRRVRRFRPARRRPTRRCRDRRRAGTSTAARRSRTVRCATRAGSRSSRGSTPAPAPRTRRPTSAAPHSISVRPVSLRNTSSRLLRRTSALSGTISRRWSSDRAASPSSS